ncbi:3D-(3,5/4)-trihydroxycyclohexane-1,2-dione acylhydrolase (decyclizing) [Marinihelvus fidelis]|uniref:3D-(3,5/4)-trihydroxycyclohexane-1,2-dione acylhydrolase (Decyclizing) n=2 Tax=Marinihelvus fidelis TaxID=2613842 RepID=A0A5N0T9K9_9GAMM|nr:3D-(3,5/4)-trihydroxycyclohexane-1,2-dione acylhydrolase (decyclizing) [Marinihelvus fidelis]
MTTRLTTAQALVRYLAAQHTQVDGERVPLFAGCWAIFGHGNVTGMGEALQHQQSRLPTFRAHNEQAMAHAAIAYAKASQRRRMMACTTSIGPGATNMVTAAALAHVNRLPVLLLPGDVFASRRPDPVLQQVEDFNDATVSANDCFRPVSRYFDRIMRPEQLLDSLPRALSVLTDAADCGPVTLCLPQDVQPEAFDWPESFFEPVLHVPARPRADRQRLARAAEWLNEAERPLVVSGGGVLYSGAEKRLGRFTERRGIPVAETQAGKGALPWGHATNVGALGVTGSEGANAMAAEADVVLAIGTRLQDFSTASNTLFNPNARVIAINPCRHDAIKAGALALSGDADETLAELEDLVSTDTAVPEWRERVASARDDWDRTITAAFTAPASGLPGDAHVLGVLDGFASDATTVVCAAGGLPGELHKLWRASGPGSYHLEYGYSCMGYEIAAGIGIKLADPAREVVVTVGDGSYLMMNSELATAVAMGLDLTVVLLDNGGFGCIERLQTSCGGDSFNNLFPADRPSRVDFAAHAAALGAQAVHVPDLEGLAAALDAARERGGVNVIVIDTDPLHATAEGGAWWDVPVAEVSDSATVRDALGAYHKVRKP